MSKKSFYQIVTFLDTQPVIGQSIYGDENGGWLPQLALKRRTELVDINEAELIAQLQDFTANQSAFDFSTGTITRLDTMPVDAIPLIDDSAVHAFHNGFIRALDDHITSKYVDREGPHFLPHITVEYWDKYVIDAPAYENRRFHVDSVWLVKDGEDGATYTVWQFQLVNL